MKTAGRRLGIALMAAAATAIGAVGVQPGVASHNSGTCEYVELGIPGAAGNEIRIRRNGGTTTLGRSGDRIVIEGMTCTGGTPTVENIDRIVILTQSRRDLRLELADGPLAPGASETGPGAEIGIVLPSTTETPRGSTLTVITGDGANAMTFGRQADDEVANLNPKRERRKDVDVLFEDVPLDDAYGDFYPGAGDDVMDARGTGIGRTSAMRIHIHPEEGDDRVFGGLAYMHAHLERKAGRDLYVAGRAGSLLGPGPGPDVRAGRPRPGHDPAGRRSRRSKRRPWRRQDRDRRQDGRRGPLRPGR